jgi:hypothetical protein
VSDLRQYEPWEIGSDGYPFAWHGRCTCDQVAVMDGSDMCFYGACTADVPAVKDLIREEAQNRCERCWHPYSKGEGEWSPCDSSCKHGGQGRWRFTRGEDWKYTQYLDHAAILWTPDIVVEARYRILTVHHLDQDKANCRWWNLVALCQRCHLLIQRKVVMGRPWAYDHSEWFKPYAAAFYAFKYLGEDLSREEVMARMPELLALEHQGTQESLL